MLTASLRIQTNGENKAEFGTISPERYAKLVGILWRAVLTL